MMLQLSKGFILEINFTKELLVAHVCNPSTPEAEDRNSGYPVSFLGFFLVTHTDCHMLGSHVSLIFGCGYKRPHLSKKKKNLRRDCSMWADMYPHGQRECARPGRLGIILSGRLGAQAKGEVGCGYAPSPS